MLQQLLWLHPVQIGPMTNDEGDSADSFLIRMGQVRCCLCDAVCLRIGLSTVVAYPAKFGAAWQGWRLRLRDLKNTRGFVHQTANFGYAPNTRWPKAFMSTGFDREHVWPLLYFSHGSWHQWLCVAKC